MKTIQANLELPNNSSRLYFNNKQFEIELPSLSPKWSKNANTPKWGFHQKLALSENDQESIQNPFKWSFRESKMHNHHLKRLLVSWSSKRAYPKWKWQGVGYFKPKFTNFKNNKGWSCLFKQSFHKITPIVIFPKTEGMKKREEKQILKPWK